MSFALIIIFAFTAGGLALSYFYDNRSTLVYRIAAGAVTGMVLFGFAGMLAAAIAGLSGVTVLFAALAATAPVALFLKRKFRTRLQRDLAELYGFALRSYSDLTLLRSFTFLAYACLFVMLWFFFRRAMLVMPGGGIGTGAANNLGDLPFHLLVINGLTTGQTFPPDNPIFSGTTLSYAFVTDLVAAMLTLTGAGVRDAMFIQNFVLAVAIVALLAWLTFSVTRNVFAASIAPFLFLFAGGFGFLLFFSDSTATDAGVLGQIFQLKEDYTLRGGTIWRWGNPLTTLFITQRTLLLGLSTALVIFTSVFNLFDSKAEESEIAQRGIVRLLYQNRGYLFPGLLAGFLPLVHTHTFLVVAFFSAVFAVASSRKWRSWAFYFVGMAAAAIPQLIYIRSGTATAADQFFGWDLAWDNGDHNGIWFWFVNTGLFIPLLLIAIWFLAVKSNSDSNAADDGGRNVRRILLFFVPFALCFIAANVLRMAPWIWDNVKVLIFWYVGAVPLVAWLLADLRFRMKGSVVLVPVLMLFLTLSGWLDVWRVASGQIEHQILSPSLIGVANDLKTKIPRDSLIVTAPEFAALPVLTGSRWFLGYTGHVWSHGIAPYERDAIVKKIYSGGAEARELIREHGIDYVVVGPQERQFTKVDEKFFEGFPIAAQTGDYKVFRVTEGVVN